MRRKLWIFIGSATLLLIATGVITMRWSLRGQFQGFDMPIKNCTTEESALGNCSAPMADPEMLGYHKLIINCATGYIVDTAPQPKFMCIGAFPGASYPNCPASWDCTNSFTQSDLNHQGLTFSTTVKNPVLRSCTSLRLRSGAKHWACLVTQDQRV